MRRPPRGSPWTQHQWFSAYTRSWRAVARLCGVTVPVMG